jgi:hypothetical protein
MNTLYSYTRTSPQVSLQASTAFFSLTSNKEWVSGDRAAIVEWSYDVSSDNNGVAYHKVFRQEQLPFAEFNQQTEFGNWYYSAKSATSLTHRSGADTVTRQQFATTGFLDDTADANYRSIRDAWPVFAFAEDLGSVGSSSISTLFQLSLHQKDAIQFLGENGVQTVPSLWTSYFSDDVAAVGRSCDSKLHISD